MAGRSTPLAPTHGYDEEDWLLNNWLWRKASNLSRIESMNITNDPRFFAGNVMEKRLGAFKSLTMISSIMFGTALGQCFQLKKDMNFENVQPLVGNIAMWQIIAFFLALMVAIQCLLSLFIICQQLFYTYRLMTAGSLGYDLSAVFYLTRTITMWRHLSIKMLYNGLLKFLILVAIQLFVQFYKDAANLEEKHTESMVINLQDMTSVNYTANMLDLAKPKHALDMRVHVGLGYLTLAICTTVTIVMRMIKRQHEEVFDQNYKYCAEDALPIERAVNSMGTRGGSYLET